MALQIIKSFITNNRCYQQAVKRTPIGIQIHTIGTAQGTAKAVVDYWNSSSVSAATTYICDADAEGRVYQMLPEEYYSWADGGYGNRNLITIEIAESDWMRYKGGASYDVTSKALFEADILRGYKTAVALCADICKRYKWDPMSKLPSGLYLVSSHDEGRKAGLSTSHVDPSHLWPPLGLSMDTFRQAVKDAMNGKTDISTGTATVPTNNAHQYYRVRTTWEDASSQLGAFTVLANAKSACPPGYSVFDETGKAVYTRKVTNTTGTQAADFKGLSEGKAAEKILEMVRTCDDSGILYSVTAAQMILESGYVTTNLAKIANNVFGLKANLSGNTWDSVWDGKSKVTIPTKEWSSKTGWVTINDVFRKYGSLEECIKDHAQYLLCAKNGNKLRYEGLVTSPNNYKEAITIIKNGGYATDPSYIDKICSIVQRFSLDRYDSYILSERNTEMNATVKKAVDWALATAKDNTHGYDNTKGKRTGPDYACSSFIAAAWRAAGLTTIPANAYTATMRKYFLAAGFVDISDKVDLRTGKGMIAGDVVLNPGKHVEMVVNAKHQLVGARGNATGGAENGKKGDQTGKEIAVAAWADYGWRFCLRYTKEDPYYKVQFGFYKTKGNATKKQKALTGINTEIIERNGGYSVVLKTKYKTAETAAKGVKTYKNKGYDCCVVEVKA